MVFWLLVFRNITLYYVVVILIFRIYVIVVLIFIVSQMEISNLGVFLFLRVSETIATVALANKFLLL